MKTVLNLMLLLFTSSCAGVKLYTDPGLTASTGLKLYNSKPYLLVEYVSGEPIRSTIQYLPDLTMPFYAKVIRGLGSNDFQVAITNGSLASYGVTTDSKAPELISSLAEVATGIGTLAKDLEEASRTTPKEQNETKVRLFEIKMSESGTSLEEVSLTDY